MKTQNLIDAKWVKASLPSFSQAKTRKLFGSQPKAFKALKGKRHVILNAPTGWGKTIVMVMLVVYKLLRNKKLRCIIAVPQTIIANGFTSDGPLKIPGIRKAVDWCIGQNLCHVEAANTVEGLIAFLRSPNRSTLSIGDRVLLCTHATLAHSFKKLKRSRRLGLLDNLVLWVDEAHHVMNAQVVGGNDTVSNAIGALVKHCIQTGCHVGLATATFMRSDRRHILPDAVTAKFTRFNVPYDEYFETMAPIESFKLNIVCGDVLDAMGSLLRKMQPTIIYLAKRQSQHGKGCKYTEVKQIVRLLAKRVKGKISRRGALIHVGHLKVLDLVTERGRKKRQQYLQGGGHLDLIIALDTCKEGFDWPEVERSIIIGERHSITEMIQMIGRLFRSSPGKRHADVYQILPAAVRNTKSFKDDRNAVMTVIFSAMLLEDVFVPISVKSESGRRGKQLANLIQNTDAWQALSRDFLVAIGGRTYEQSKRLMPATLKKHGIPKADWETTWENLWVRHANVVRKLQGLRLDVPFEVLKKTDMTGGMLMLCSDLCGVETFRELRDIIGRADMTLEEKVLEAEELALENRDGALTGRAGVDMAGGMKKAPGLLPCDSWLTKTGRGHLVKAIQKHPGAFAHIPQERLRQTDEEHIATLMRLTANGKNPLPARKTLVEIEGEGFCAWWSANRTRFPKIHQTTLRVTDDHHKETLIRLTANGKNPLPPMKTLKESEGCGFHAWWGANRALYPQIRQTSLRNIIANGYKATLIRLTASGKKPLPLAKTLIETEGNGFYQWWWANRALYPQIHQTSIWRRGDHHKATLMRLTANGTKPLPARKTLVETEEGGFYRWWWANRALYPQIHQTSIWRRGDHHKATLMRLTANGKTLLAPAKTLVETEGAGFYAWWKANRTRYPKIKQQRLNKIGKIAA